MKEAPVGEWRSPISSEVITSSSIRLGSVKIASDGSFIYLEARPSESGRAVLMRQKPGEAAEQLSPGPDSGINVRTTVHEYGGGDYVVGDGVLYFSNFKDQRMYQQQLSPAPKPPEPLTPDGKGLRYADAIVDPQRSRLIVVQEDHSAKGEAVNTIAAVDLSSGESTILVSGNDFYASPAISKDGTQLAWVTWNHPNMPWDDTELWAGKLDATGTVTSPRKCVREIVYESSMHNAAQRPFLIRSNLEQMQVGGGSNESVLQPTWTADGKLLFISDRSGWWNLYREASPGNVKHLWPLAAEFAGPAWMLGSHSYAALSDGRILAQYSDPKDTEQALAIFDERSGGVQRVAKPFAALGSLYVVETGGTLRLGSVGASPQTPSSVIALETSLSDLASVATGDWTVLKKSSDMEIDEGYLSRPETIEFPTTNGLTAFMNYYPPANKDFRLPAGMLPPLLVKIHGGPTAQASTGFSPLYQYWTSRGFAISDVNYGGSTGYGREYRQRLKGQWGVVDVDDCVNAASHLAKQGKADERRLCIDGGSAGGYTALAALAFRNVFSAGASLYGVADCELLAQETHKFESHYLDGLIGPLPAARDTYVARSPIHAIDKFEAPIIFFQGLEDKVVPPNQAVNMFEQLKAKGLPTALVLFEGEQHGFRGTDAIRRALDGEFYFYGRALGFPAAMPDGLPAPEVVNLAPAK